MPRIVAHVLVGSIGCSARATGDFVAHLGETLARRSKRLLSTRACLRELLPGLTCGGAQQLFHILRDHLEVFDQLVFVYVLHRLSLGVVMRTSPGLLYQLCMVSPRAESGKAPAPHVDKSAFARIETPVNSSSTLIMRPMCAAVMRTCNRCPTNMPSAMNGNR